MKEKILGLILAVIIVVFLVGTFYAFAKTILAIIGLGTVISWVLKLWTKSKEPKDAEVIAFPKAS